MCIILQFLLYSSIIYVTFTSSNAVEIQLECSRRSDMENHDISRVLEICDLNKFNISKIYTNVSFISELQPTFTGLEIEESKFSILPKEILDYFPNLEYLRIAFTSMTEIKDYTFRDEPQLLQLEFVINELTEITEFTFAGTENLINLNLGNNKITSISPKAFVHMSKLEKLILAVNKITSLDKDIFSQLKNLKFLDIGFNKLTFVEPKIVIHNEQLSHIYFGKNEFSEVELDLSTKQMEFMGFKNIEKLTVRTFADSTVIDELGLQLCKFQNISDLIVDEKIIVKSIDFSLNQLTSLAAPPNYLRHVKKLKFNHNLIEEIPESFIQELTNLESLHISYNKMKMSPNMFENLRNLTVLSLSGNELGKLDHEWFTGLPKLEKLNFEDNNVTSFDYMSLLNHLPALKYLNIHENNFKCDYLRKMVQDLKKINRIEVLQILGIEEEEQSDNHVYQMRCDRHLNSRK